MTNVEIMVAGNSLCFYTAFTSEYILVLIFLLKVQHMTGHILDYNIHHKGM
jgi:hypothetical protein